MSWFCADRTDGRLAEVLLIPRAGPQPALNFAQPLLETCFNVH